MAEAGGDIVIGVDAGTSVPPVWARLAAVAEGARG